MYIHACVQHTCTCTYCYYVHVQGRCVHVYAVYIMSYIHVHIHTNYTYTGGVGFDINCGVRLIRTNLFEKDVTPIKEQLAQVYTNIATELILMLTCITHKFARSVQ